MRLALVPPLVVLALAALACSGGESAQPAGAGAAKPPTTAGDAPGAGATAKGDAERGRKLYLANCIACHNADPSQPGAVGPDVAGSSLALLEARILHAAYPDGYTPKRTSHLMVALPYLAPSIPDIAAYLDSVKSASR